MRGTMNRLRSGRQPLDAMNCKAEHLRLRYFDKAPGCYWNPALAIQERANGDRVIVATREIQSDDCLVILDHARNLTTDAARDASHWDLSDLSDELAIPALLCQLFLGEDVDLLSRVPTGFNHYLQVLPSHQWYASNHATLALRQAAPDDFKPQLDRVFPLLEFIQTLNTWLTEELSKDVPIEVVERAVLCGFTRTWAECGMVPFADFFNHRPDGCMLSTNNCQLTANQYHAPGSEVGVCYGIKDALSLMMNYGFLSADDAMAVSRQEASRWAICVDPELEDYNANLEVKPFLLFHDLSNIERLLAESRLWSIDQHDLSFVNNLDRDYLRPISMANEQRAITHLLAGFAQEQGPLEQRLHVLEQCPPLEQQSAPWRELISRRLETLKRAEAWLKHHWSTFLPELSD